MIFGQPCYLGLSFISQILQIFLKPEIGLIVDVLCILCHSLQNALVYTAYLFCVCACVRMEHMEARGQLVGVNYPIMQVLGIKPRSSGLAARTSTTEAPH